MDNRVIIAFVTGLLVSAIPFGIIVYSQCTRSNSYAYEMSTFRGVNLRTDKESYGIGETINITLNNKLEQTAYVFAFDCFQVEKWNESWESIYSYILTKYLLEAYQGKIEIAQAQSVPSGTSLVVSWNQTMIRLSYNYSSYPYPTPMLNYSQLSAGEYRLKMTVPLRYGSLEGAEPQNSILTYSNRFTIGSS